MEDDILEGYLDHTVTVYLITPDLTGSGEMEGVLRNYSTSGVLLELEGTGKRFVPFTSIHSMEFREKLSWWERFLMNR